MGEVVLAEHAELGKRVVVKMLHAHLLDDPRLLERARLEAQTLGNLKHPSIVEVTDFGHTPAGRPYLVMERLRGFTLADEIGRRGALGVSESLRLARELLSALGAAHARGIVRLRLESSSTSRGCPAGGLGVAAVCVGLWRLRRALVPCDRRSDGYSDAPDWGRASECPLLSADLLWARHVSGPRSN
jgi:hypothetical protein